jgi:hypothetical protein
VESNLALALAVLKDALETVAEESVNSDDIFAEEIMEIMYQVKLMEDELQEVKND